MTVVYWSITPSILLGLAIIQLIALRYWLPRKQTPQQKQVRQILQFSTAITLQATLLYIGFALTIYTVQQFETLSTRGALIGATVLAFLFAVLIVACFEAGRYVQNHYLSPRRNQRDERTVIKHYGQRLSSALDIQRVGDTVLHLMVETLGIEQGVVLVNQRQVNGETFLRPLASISMDNIPGQHFNHDSPFLHHFREKEELLSYEKITTTPVFAALSPEERAWIDTLQLEWYTPMLRQRELIGVLAFGSVGTRYYEEDIELMKALADQAALAMDSARLFEQLALINQEVGSLTDQLAGYDQKKTDFLSIASHELRTPLTHIHGYSKMILDLTEEEMKDPAYLKMMINGIAKGSERLKDVVDMMFDVTEADVGSMVAFYGPVKLEQVIKQAMQPLLADFDQRRMAFDAESVKGMPVIQADGTRLVQAFEHLLGNALKYTPDGGLVRVESERITQDGQDMLQISVIDNGIGIAPENQEKVFEKFFRVDSVNNHSTSKSNFKGAGPGLGLTLVKGIVEAHKGKVWVESAGYDEEALLGSKFTMVLPVHSSETDSDQIATELPKKRQSQIETRHWKRPPSE